MNKSSIAKPQAEAQGRGKIIQVSLFDFRRQYAGIREEMLPDIERVCASEQFILGSEVEKLESEIAAFICHSWHTAK